MNYPRLLLLAVGSTLVLSSCSSYKVVTPPAPPPVTQKTSEIAPVSGYVPDIDEPSTRGQLSRISPPNMDIARRFAVSPDGKSIVFSGRPVGSTEPYQLYRVDNGSAAPVKLTSGGASEALDPSFTADGEYIIFRTETTFWKMKKNGTGAKVRLSGSGLGIDLHPQVSSKGRLAFVTLDAVKGAPVIWTIGLDGADLTQYREGTSPVWSPDGSKIAFEYDDDIYVINADGTELTPLTSTPGIGEYKPFFSPDGKSLVYASNEDALGKPSTDLNIWTMSIDASNKRQVTELASWDSWPLWTKDGIYFLSARAKIDQAVVRIWKVKV